VPRKKRIFNIPPGERLLTILEVAERLQVSRDTVHRRINEGALERVYIARMSPRITGASFERFLLAVREGREPPRYQPQKGKASLAVTTEKPPERSGVVGKLKGWLGV
jgi:excisionase family DNA binding protein